MVILPNSLNSSFRHSNVRVTLHNAQQEILNYKMSQSLPAAFNKLHSTWNLRVSFSVWGSRILAIIQYLPRIYQNYAKITLQICKKNTSTATEIITSNIFCYITLYYIYMHHCQFSHRATDVTNFRGGSRDFEKRWRSMQATMVGRRTKFQVSDGLKRPKYRQKL